MNRFIWHLFLSANIILSFIINLNPCCAQVYDDFSDSDFLNNPSWQGSDNLWQVANGILQSNSDGAATYYLSTGNQLAEDVEFEFLINLKFATSGANYVDVFLLSDSSNLLQTKNGYCLRLGGTNDAVSLFKLLNGASSILIEADGVISSSSDNPFQIKVIRDTGLWTLMLDKGYTGVYDSIGSIADSDINTTSSFGFLIKQSTASAPKHNHFFDNVIVQEIGADRIPPSIVNVDFIAMNKVSIEFSEEVLQSTAEEVANYKIDDALPSRAELEDSGLKVELTFDHPFVEGTLYQMSVENIEDLLSNKLVPFHDELTFYLAQEADFKDLIINEIMADYEPSVGLPTSEFVELYNRSEKTIHLDNWSLSDASSSGVISESYLLAGEYVILCPEGFELEYSDYGQVATVDPWPSLNNGGDQLVIKSSIAIDSVEYDDGWHSSSSNRDGGWSLELIDPNNLCGGAANWSSSTDIKGGTPGAQNSIKSDKPDLMGPELLEVFAVSEDSVLIRFNEVLDASTIQANDFIISPSVNVIGVELSDDLQSAWLSLSEGLKARQAYQLDVVNITDCNGNKIHLSSKAEFYLIEKPENGELVINEVLFNPRTGGVDFVELYNDSEKYINLKDWKLSNGSSYSVISTNYLVIAPHEFIVFTDDPVILHEQYPLGNIERFFEADLPSFPNDQGTVEIQAADSLINESFDYDEDLHFELLKSVEGVSLERISITASANDANNWKSAASSVGYATPGYKNSQLLEPGQLSMGSIDISPRIIIPDGSGQADYTTISYSFDKPGYVSNVEVFDSNGRSIKMLAANDYLAAEGFYVWDGVTDEGHKARVGYYIIYFQVFDDLGNERIYKERLAVGTTY
ncbi:lamin tail domain-containing protein [Fulvivirga ligni]|uniref:lamin tail domain-containing protein n=1 Tax=Fulvivirga ligni TaxID=2904246 RepID=UPI001F416DAB|nr:lamin tail domain-containing protein [Fulvivirga ligni]UII22425.1 lamin tail domain-containing protein [Fulvivirga ligni]